MSGFVHPGATGLPLHERTQHKHCDEYWFDNEDLFQGATLFSVDWNSALEAAGFVSPWWPFNGGIVQGMAGEGFEAFLQQGPRHSDMWRSFGANGRLSVLGTTRDQYGSPLGGCTVRLFRTLNDSLQSRVKSDANGAFQVSSPFTDAHYMTVHGPGGVAGASVDTLIPA